MNHIILFIWVVVVAEAAIQNHERRNKIQLLNYMKKNLWEAGTYSSEEDAQVWIDDYNEGLREISSAVNLAGYEFNTNITDYNEHKYEDLSTELAQWLNDNLNEAKRFYDNLELFQDPSLVRQISLIVDSFCSPKNESYTKRMTELETSMLNIYATTTIKVDGKNLSEPDRTDIMANSRDPDELLEVWKKWRDAVGPPLKPLYQEWVAIANVGARDNGFADHGECWRLQDYEVDNLDDFIYDLFDQIKPMYLQLHAYVRRKLIEKYPDVDIDPEGPIPAHLLGNMWAQQWNDILDIVVPYPDTPSYDVTDQMVDQGYDPMKMFEVAEEFYMSLGLEPMTDKFWAESMIVKPNDREVECHGAAHDMLTDDDFRISMCTVVTMQDFQTVHHEMGHIQYYMQYRNQPTVFRSGANAAFHEAIGDTMALSVMTPEHLQKIGLLEDGLDSASNSEQYRTERQRRDINFLMKMALEKVAFLPFGLLIDEWRWKVFNGEIDEAHYNSKWWELRLKYQGLKPPVPRSEDDFDPGSKYHIPSATPYIRYFLSFIGQFQFHKALCYEAGHSDAPHRCDIYRSKEAGEKLMSMLSMGMSRPWPEAMEKLTGKKDFDASAILDYFRPLMEWLEAENKDETLGWN